MTLFTAVETAAGLHHSSSFISGNGINIHGIRITFGVVSGGSGEGAKGLAEVGGISSFAERLEKFVASIDPVIFDGEFNPFFECVGFSNVEGDFVDETRV